METLVTIHVHQRDVMNDLATLHRQKRISDANDFEWLKQVYYIETNAVGTVVQYVCKREVQWFMILLPGFVPTCAHPLPPPPKTLCAPRVTSLLKPCGGNLIEKTRG